MSLLQEISDKGATTAWCPIKQPNSLIALGSKDGASGETFDDYGGELAVYGMDFTTANRGSPKLIGKTATSTRFNCLAWGSKGPSGLGVIAGGMQNGAINIWDPKKIENPLAVVEKHKSKVNSLQFNPHPATAHLMATGASDNEVYIVDLNNPAKPNVYSPAGPGCQKHSAEVRSVAWNTEVVHVLATAALDGVCTVWSLKAKKPWAEIRDPSGAGFSAIAWSPAQGLHLLTASNDDRDPVLRLWDVRSSTTQPLAEYRGHTGGIFSVSWCTSDPSYVLSCAKDNRTLLWDLYSGKAVYELGGGSASKPASSNGYQPGLQGQMNGYGGHNAAFGDHSMGGGANAAFGGAPQASNIFEGSTGLGGGGSGRRYQVQFSPHDRTLFSACSLDRKVQVFSINGANGGNTNAQNAVNSNPPRKLRGQKWMVRPCGGAFGFGGKFVSFASPPQPAQGEQPSSSNAPRRGIIRVSSIVDSPEFVQRAIDWDQEITQALQMDLQQQSADPSQPAYTNLIQICTKKAGQSKDPAERDIWSFMKVLFEPSARDKILQELGFNMDAITALVSAMDKRAVPAEPQQNPNFEEQNVLDQQNLSSPQPQSQEQNGFSPDQGTIAQNGAPSQVFESMQHSGSALGAFDDFNPEEEKRVEEDVVPPAEQESEPAPPTPVEEPQQSEPQIEKVVRSLQDVSLDDVEVKDPKVDDLINKALLIGNFPVAVDICLENNRFADALLLSTCGGGALYDETVHKYLEKFYGKKPYVPILAAVVKTELDTFVQRSELSGDKWKEVLAIVSQYGKSEQVPGLCEILAGRLQTERTDSDAMIAACLCYICAKNVEKTVDIFLQEGQKLSAVEMAESVVQKTSVYLHALSDPQSMMSIANVMEQYLNYSEALANQGLLDYAAKYISSIDTTVMSAQQQEYDTYGNPVGTPQLSKSEQDHNTQAQRALELSDRVYGAHSNPVQDLGQYIPARVVPFQVKQFGVAPSNTPYVPEPPAPVQQEFQQQNQMNTYASSSSNQGNAYGGAYGGNAGAPSNAPAPQYQPQNTQQGFGVPQQPQFNNAAPAQPQFNNAAPAQPQFNNAAQPSQFNSAGPPQPQFNNAPQQQQQFNNAPQQQQQFNSNPPFGGQQSAPATPMTQQQPAPQASRPQSSSSYVPENDGFGSTAGNPAAGQKYGNLTGAAAQQPFAAAAGGSQPGYWNPNQTTQQPQQQAAPAPAVPRVMPPQMGPVVQSLEQHLQRLGGAAVSAMDKRKLTDVTKSVEALKEKLMTGKVQEDLFPEITQLIQAIVGGDMNTANSIRSSLTARTHVWAEQKEWLKGMTSLVLLSRSLAQR